MGRLEPLFATPLVCLCFVGAPRAYSGKCIVVNKEDGTGPMSCLTACVLCWNKFKREVGW